MNTTTKSKANPTTQTTTPEQVVNGMSVTKLMETIEAIQETPALADFKFRARNQWQDGGHNRATVNSYQGTLQEHRRKEDFVFDADEPPVLLGEDRGANPVEFLLTALSACMTTTLAYHAAAQGHEIEAIESEYEGDIDLHGFLGLDPNVPKGYKEIRVKFKVKTDEKNLEQLKSLASFSPVYNSLINGVKVDIKVERK
jgi:uncharacterized OsmC-like protein